MKVVSKKKLMKQCGFPRKWDFNVSFNASCENPDLTIEPAVNVAHEDQEMFITINVMIKRIGLDWSGYVSVV